MTNLNGLYGNTFWSLKGTYKSWNENLHKVKHCIGLNGFFLLRTFVPKYKVWNIWKKNIYIYCTKKSRDNFYFIIIIYFFINK